MAALFLINTFENNAGLVSGDIVSYEITEKQYRILFCWHCKYQKAINRCISHKLLDNT